MAVVLQHHSSAKDDVAARRVTVSFHLLYITALQAAKLALTVRGAVGRQGPTEGLSLRRRLPKLRVTVGQALYLDAQTKFECRLANYRNYTVYYRMEICSSKNGNPVSPSLR